jgi:UTP--glucose-1-phosphate uridylyltransferase
VSVGKTYPSVLTGVIAAAGAASRMWPASKVLPKELFPLGRLPVLAYVIFEMVEAGIEHIVVVVRNDGSGSIETFLNPQVEPPQGVGQDALVTQFEQVLRMCRFTVVAQRGPYGNGTPLLNAVELLAGQPCIYAFADDIVFGENVSLKLVDAYQRKGHAVLAAQTVSEEELSKFGVVECAQGQDISYVTRFIEKPQPGTTASRLASLGRYLITADVVDALRSTGVGRGGELWLSDAFVQMLRVGLPLAVAPLTSGQWYTVGTAEGFRRAVAASAEADSSLAARESCLR